ncbi:MAG: hypothetical protein M3512_12145, partial [Bacteroidota bacterium]|nr:hypothetical protein [Bacteroidota bacterium]
YTLKLDLQNSIAGESIAEEVEEEAGEHMFFFGWTSGLFSDPTGDGCRFSFRLGDHMDNGRCQNRYFPCDLEAPA